MYKALISLTILFPLLWSCSSCNSQNHDSDYDFDHDSQDEQDLHDYDVQDTDITDSAVIPDEDTVCEPYSGECELEETTLCRSGSVYK